MPFNLYRFLIWGLKSLCVMGHVAEIMVLILSKLNTWPNGLFECMHHYCAMLANKGLHKVAEYYYSVQCHTKFTSLIVSLNTVYKCIYSILILYFLEIKVDLVGFYFLFSHSSNQGFSHPLYHSQVKLFAIQ